MGMADVATVLFKDFLKFNPKDLAGLIEIDLFFLLGMVQCYFTLLYLTGYKSVSLNDIKNFRQLNPYALDILNITQILVLKQLQVH